MLKKFLLLLNVLLSFIYWIFGALGQVPWIIGWGDSRRPYPSFSSAGYGTPLVNLLNGIGLVLLVVTVLSYGYKKRNLFWCLFPFGLGNMLFVLTSQIRKQSR